MALSQRAMDQSLLSRKLHRFFDMNPVVAPPFGRWVATSKHRDQQFSWTSTYKMRALNCGGTGVSHSMGSRASPVDPPLSKSRHAAYRKAECAYAVFASEFHLVTWSFNSEHRIRNVRRLSNTSNAHSNMIYALLRNWSHCTPALRLFFHNLRVFVEIRLAKFCHCTVLKCNSLTPQLLTPVLLVLLYLFQNVLKERH